MTSYKTALKNIFFSRHALWSMSVTQLKSRYAGSVLGIFWAVINPLLMMSAVTFVFTGVLKTEIKDFHFFVLSGIMPWMFFSSALSEAAGSILSQQNIMRQFNVSSALFPLSSVLSSFLNFLIGWVAIYPLFLFFNPQTILLLPLLFAALLLQLCLVCGFGLALAVFNVFFRDIGHLVGVVLMFWFWVTPVFYPMEMVPERFSWLYNINPMTSYSVFYQKVLFESAVPALLLFLQMGLWALFSLLMGLAMFLKLEPELSKKI